MFYIGFLVVLVVLPLLFFTYAYHLALIITVLFCFLSGWWLSSHKAKSQIKLIFEISSQGVCAFDNNHRYQLLESSRFSFFGCWLVLQPVITTDKIFRGFNGKNSRGKSKVLFIYRDSLSQQDFSRLSNIIAQLSNHASNQP